MHKFTVPGAVVILASVLALPTSLTGQHLATTTPFSFTHVVNAPNPFNASAYTGVTSVCDVTLNTSLTFQRIDVLLEEDLIAPVTPNLNGVVTSGTLTTATTTGLVPGQWNNGTIRWTTPDTLGTSTASSTTTMVNDSIGGFVVGTFNGGTITFTSGPNSGVTRPITTNSANQVNWTNPLTTAPVAGDTYYLTKPLGTYNISTNTTTTITISGTFVNVPVAGDTFVLHVAPHYVGTTIPVTVWAISGSWIGNMTSATPPTPPAGWTTVSTGSAVIADSNSHTSCLLTPFTLAAGSYGIALQLGPYFDPTIDPSTGLPIGNIALHPLITLTAFNPLPTSVSDPWMSISNENYQRISWQSGVSGNTIVDNIDFWYGPPGGGTGNTANIQYSQLTTQSPPSPRTAFGLAPLPNGSSILLFGGNDGGPSFNDETWTLSGGVWTQQLPANSPTRRAEFAMSGDAVRQNVVLFGGRNANNIARGDTWTFDGFDWTAAPVPGPSARFGHAMTFDALNGVTVLFGGQDSSGTFLGDTWTWNGTAWTQRALALSPTARRGHSLAFDSLSLRNRTVLYGGEDGAGARDDIWEYDGVTWTQITPAGSGNPGTRRNAAMVYDPRAAQVILFGGDGGNNTPCNGDAWSWDGTSWTTLLDYYYLNPPARDGATLVFDPMSNHTLLFGGGCGTNLFNDLWEVLPPVLASGIAFGSGCAGTGGVPTLAIANNSASVLGTTFQLTLGNLPTSLLSPQIVVIGFNNQVWGNMSLPADLGFVGLPGCVALTSDDLQFFLPASPSGTSPWSVAIPNDPNLLGLLVYFQALVFDPQTNGRWASVTNGIQARIGNQ
jgi:hypothetical protein